MKHAPFALLALLGLASCAGPGQPGLFAQPAPERAFACPDGHTFTAHLSAQQMVLSFDGATSHPHELDHVVLGQGITYQDADYRYSNNGSPGSVQLTNLHTGQTQTCRQP